MNMRHSTVLYCIGCETIIDLEQAEVIFKTGFYKIKYPLAVCKACYAQSEQSLYQAAEELAVTYEDYLQQHG